MFPFSKFDFLIPQKIYLNHLADATTFVQGEGAPEISEAQRTSALFYWNTSVATFLSTKQTITQSKFVILKKNGKCIRSFVDFNVSDENSAGHLVVNIDRLLELNKKWLVKVMSIGACCSIGVFAVWRTALMIHCGIKMFCDFRQTMNKMFSNIDDMKYFLSHIKSSVIDISHDVDRIDIHMRRLK